ncbi:hypothetical protein EDC39_11266 [Geothermobacter ehrlichii]|uniref:Uncharacterized protein n=1 Tax=Geothermobacter ehrlichii TaxID=213224 RepID=A0A5D3WI72_9BACT|nr:hypothetical protein [Geothermobacter ehrlichii]TYO96778.1 hypothetical protein EDC39_11266 [Geothermobacter ehrlichii]
MGKDTGTTDIMPMPDGQEIHPKGFLEAISFIEQSFANELGGAIIRDTFLTTKQRLEFFEVGFRSSFLSGLISALLTPIAIGVVERYIPIFGDADPSRFDLVFAFMLAVGYSIGFAIFLAYACTKFIGSYTRSMIRNLLGGVVAGSILKAILAFLGFHFLYFVVLSDANMVKGAQLLYKAHLPRRFVMSAYSWIYDFKPVLLTSAWFVVGVTLVFILIPTVSMVLATIRNRKLIKAGLVHVE